MLETRVRIALKGWATDARMDMRELVENALADAVMLCDDCEYVPDAAHGKLQGESVRFGVELSPSLWADIKRICQGRGITMGHFMREALAAYADACDAGVLHPGGQVQ
jgi:hypothetical protein